MANALYDKAREAFLNADLDWAAHEFRVIVIDEAEYTPNLATDQYLDDIPADARVAVSSALTSKTSTNGYADSADPVFSGLTGPTIESVVLYRHTGTDSSSELVGYYNDAAGLVFTPSGADLILQVNAQGWFRL